MAFIHTNCTQRRGARGEPCVPPYIVQANAETKIATIDDK
jgi:hypothetical protein